MREPYGKAYAAFQPSLVHNSLPSIPQSFQCGRGRRPRRSQRPPHTSQAPSASLRSADSRTNSQLFADAPKKPAHQLRNASAKNKHIGFEQVDNVPGPNRQKVRRLSKHFGGKLIPWRNASATISAFTASISPPDSRAFSIWREATQSDAIRPDKFCKPFSCAPRDRRTGAQRLDTAAFPAAASRSAIIDRHVPALGCASRSPVINSPVKNDPRANARSERRVKNISITHSGAPDGLG